MMRVFVSCCSRKCKTPASDSGRQAKGENTGLHWEWIVSSDVDTLKLPCKYLGLKQMEKVKPCGAVSTSPSTFLFTGSPPVESSISYALYPELLGDYV